MEEHLIEFILALDYISQCVVFSIYTTIVDSHTDRFLGYSSQQFVG